MKLYLILLIRRLCTYIYNFRKDKVGIDDYNKVINILQLDKF